MTTLEILVWITCVVNLLVFVLVIATVLFPSDPQESEKRKLNIIINKLNMLERGVSEKLNKIQEELEGFTTTYSGKSLSSFVSDSIEEQEKINEEMKTFYFVRQPDHMIECSDNFTGCEDVDLIKQKHKIFDTKEEALAYQRVLGIETEAERKRLNKWFTEEGLAKEFGYIRKPRSKEKSSDVPEAVILNGADVMRALKQFKVPSETIEQVKGDVERNYRKAIIEEKEKINEGLKENDKRKKRMKELYKGEQWSTEFECPDGYEFLDEKGNVIEAKKIVLEKKKPKYPKSYSECLEILGYHSTNLLLIGEPKDFAKVSHEEKKFTFLTLQFWKLLVCRDAYWKIAGDWKLSIGIPFYYLYYNRQLENIKKDYADDIQGNVILAFPTKEMRDAFYENFKELIEECKELL